MGSRVVTFVILILVGCLSQISSDIYTPSVPAIAHHFSTSMSNVQLSMAIYMLGIALSLFFYGPISDGIGRRKPLIVGLFIMLAGTVVCLFATSATMLLIGRFIQGCGAGAGTGLWRSIFRDIFKGDQLAKYGSYFTMVLIAVIPGAPALGGYLQQYLGWQANFVFLLIYAGIAVTMVVVKFKESSTHHHPDRLKKEFVKKSFKELFTSRVFMGYSLCVFLTYGAFFSWFAIGPVLLIHQVGISPVAFGWINLVGGSLAMMLGGFINSRLVERVGAKNMLQLGWLIMVAAGVLMLLLKFIVGVNAVAIVIPLILFYLGTTLIWPNAFAGAMSPFGHIAGYAGAMYSVLQIGGGAALGLVASHVSAVNQLPMAIIFIVAPLLAWLVFQGVIVKKLFAEQVVGVPGEK